MPDNDKYRSKIFLVLLPTILAWQPNDLVAIETPAETFTAQILDRFRFTRLVEVPPWVLRLHSGEPDAEAVRVAIARHFSRKYDLNTLTFSAYLLYRHETDTP